MPGIAENVQLWTNHHWDQQGAEWTVGYGGPEAAWHCAVLPRIRSFLPSPGRGHILEIGPGFGLWTSLLRPLCSRMTLVDLTPRCIESCRSRFGRRRMQYIVNDGMTLPGVADGQIDFAFSWHSLVHCQRNVMASYARELARTLRPGSAAVLQHSNFGAYLAEAGRPEAGHVQENISGFGEDMTAGTMADDAMAAGLQVVFQEIAEWGRAGQMASCISVLRRPVPGEAVSRGPCIENHRFWEHVRESGRIMMAFRHPSGVLDVR